VISVEQALEKILAGVGLLEAEESLILDCLGQVLAEDILSGINVPPLDNTAMDGYAVRARDTIGASPDSPRILSVVDMVAAGSISKREVGPGEAIRIMTGAPVPGGADSVVQFEKTDELQRREQATVRKLPGQIGVLHPAEVGLNIRRAGEDIKQGAKVLSRGTVIGPAEVGVLASLGRSRVRAIRRPVVAILATGDEVVDIDQPLPPGKIYNSNTYSVAALVRYYGGVSMILGIALDREDSVVAGLRRGLAADMLITTGGVSAGDYDVVKDILAKEGEITFWTVRVKPGKPLAFGMVRGRGKAGRVRNIPHLGLPGNPVSSMVTFEMFVRPAMLKMMGRKNLAKPTVEAVLEDAVVNSDGRRILARAVVRERDGRYFARLTGPQGSGILTSMSLANALVIVPEDRARMEVGEVVRVMMLDWNKE